MKPINKIDISFDVSQLKAWLEDCDLFGEFDLRAQGDSPHKEMTDIWARYKDPKEHIESGDYSGLAEKHDSKWLKDIPFIKDIASGLMDFVEGSVLGGVLITKLPSGGKIYPHKDSGWHAQEYDKYYIPIKNEKGASFCFEDIAISPIEGEVFGFRNDVTHWVENNSNSDRIAIIVCIKQNKYSKEGLLLCRGDMQPQQ